MTIALPAAVSRPARNVAGLSGLSRGVLLFVVALALAAGFLATGHDTADHAARDAGADLTRLLRAMAGLKAAMAAALTAVVAWRLGSPVGAPRLAAYAFACAAMAAGPGLIWDMDHVGAGALLLHGGLLVTVLLLWRDPEMGNRLSALVARRRPRHRD